MQGKASPLLSSFKLSYYTVLNLMRRLEDTGACGCPWYRPWYRA